MYPPLLPYGPSLDPDVVGEVVHVSGVEAESAAVRPEEVGELAASAATGLEEGARGVEAQERRFGAA